MGGLITWEMTTPAWPCWVTQSRMPAKTSAQFLRACSLPQMPDRDAALLTAAGLAMAFTLLEANQDRWRAVYGPRRVATRARRSTTVRQVMIERPDGVQVAAA